MPTFCMKAPNQSPDLLNLAYPCFIQPKINGQRGIYIPNQGFFDKSGKLLKNNDKLTNYFDCLISVTGCVLEGQFSLNTHIEKELSNCLNKYDHKINLGLKFLVFDCIPTQDWTSKSSKIPYSDRLKMLRVQLNDRVYDYDKVIDIPNDIVENSNEAFEVYKMYLKKGYEGCIIRNIDGLYDWKRQTLNNNNFFKIKPYSTLFLKIVDIYEGEEDLQGVLGGIVVDYNNSAIRIPYGFTIDERMEIWSKKKDYIGKIAEIKFFSIDDDGQINDPKFIQLQKE